jgi:hypothetical protein
MLLLPLICLLLQESEAARTDRPTAAPMERSLNGTSRPVLGGANPVLPKEEAMGCRRQLTCVAM